MPPQDADEVLKLLSHGWSGGFTPEAIARLEALQQLHGLEVSELVLEFTRLHADLEETVVSSRAFDRAVEHILAQGDPRRADQARAKSTRANRWSSLDNPFRQGFQMVRRVRTPLALAAVLMLATWAYWRGAPADRPVEVAKALQTIRIVRPPQAVACVADLTDAVWSDQQSLAIGQTLTQNQRLELTGGVAQLSMASGADIVLQAPCVVTLMADDFVFLERGRLTAQAASWATGFVVDTKGLRITDLGTRFAVSAEESGVTEAHVLEGEVLAEPMKTHRPKRSSMLLGAGQGVRVSALQATIDKFVAQGKGFENRLSQFHPLRPVQMWNTGIGQKIGAIDPHWQITAGHAVDGPYPRPAVVNEGVTVTAEAAYLDNMPDASQWISVRKEAHDGVPPDSTYTFESSFDLSGYDPATVHVAGQFLVDNSISELRINGRRVTFKKWENTWDVHDFRRFHTIEIRDGFVSGKNTIAVDVYNAPSRPEHAGRNNPLGLRVEWQAFGCEAPNPPASPDELL